MTKFDKKVDFAVLFSVRHANPNGDPLNGNRPRENYDGLGEVSDVCLKRKIRNRLQDMGERLFVQSNDRADDGLTSLRSRAAGVAALQGITKPEEYARIACEQWIDVRSFGQVFAFSGEKLSVGARGPVSLHPAFSVAPVEVESLQITKSVNSEDTAGRASDTMGTKHRVNFGLYVFFGSINVQLAEKTGFSQEDAEKIHEALRTLFENDASAARPDGSMEVRRVLWWQHDCASGQYPSAKVHRSLQVSPKVPVPASYEDFDITFNVLPGLACQDDLLG